MPEAKRDVPTEVHVVAVHVGAELPGGRAAGGTAPSRWTAGRRGHARPERLQPDGLGGDRQPEDQCHQGHPGRVSHPVGHGPEGGPCGRLLPRGSGGKPYVYVYYKVDSPRFRPAIQATPPVDQAAGAELPGHLPVQPGGPVGRERRSRTIPRLSTDYPRLSRTADLPKVAFRAVHLTPTDRFGTAASFGDFTQAGPDKASLKPLPDRIVRLAHDPKGKKYYGLTDHEVHEVDLEKKTSTKLNPKKDLDLSWPRALTFDTKRDRLLVVASNSIVEYDPAAGKWRALAGLRGSRHASHRLPPKGRRGIRGGS